MCPTSITSTSICPRRVHGTPPAAGSSTSAPASPPRSPTCSAPRPERGSPSVVARSSTLRGIRSLTPPAQPLQPAQSAGPLPRSRHGSSTSAASRCPRSMADPPSRFRSPVAVLAPPGISSLSAQCRSTQCRSTQCRSTPCAGGRPSSPDSHTKEMTRWTRGAAPDIECWHATIRSATPRAWPWSIPRSMSGRSAPSLPPSTASTGSTGHASARPTARP
jgi:hypothetical protein